MRPQSEDRILKRIGRRAHRAEHRQVSETVNHKFVEALAQHRNDDEARWLSSMASTMIRLSGDFQAAVGELDGLTQNTHGAVNAIRNAVIDVLGHAKFQDTPRQQIEHVQNGLALCGERMGQVEQVLAGDWMASLDIQTLEQVMEALRASYTMQSQHATHHAVAGGESATAESDRPAIEDAVRNNFRASCPRRRVSRLVVAFNPGCWIPAYAGMTGSYCLPHPELF